MKKIGKIAIVNTHTVTEAQKNLDFIIKMLKIASQEKADLICFPENFHYLVKRYEKLTDRIPGKISKIY